MEEFQEIFLRLQDLGDIGDLEECWESSPLTRHEVDLHGGGDQTECQGMEVDLMSHKPMYPIPRCYVDGPDKSV